MNHSLLSTTVRPASLGWRWRTIFQAVVPAARLCALADSVPDSGKLEQPLVIVSIESPLATRLLSFLESVPNNSHIVEGLLPISYPGPHKEAIVAALVRAPATSSAHDAAISVASYVAKPFIRRSIQRLLSVDHVARSFHEMLLHPPICQIIVAYQSFLKHQAADAQYAGPRIRCIAWPPEVQKSLVLKLETSGLPLGASVGDFTHLLCVVYVFDAATANFSFENIFDKSLYFALLSTNHLLLGPSPDESHFNLKPSSPSAAAAAAAADVSNQPLSSSTLYSRSFSSSHSRAQYKLHEAIEALRDATPIEFVAEMGGILASLRATFSGKKTEWCAVDVGAAPGGWSAFLAGPHVGCSKVMSVDAASLAPAVLAMPSVCHVRSSLQDALISGALDADSPYDLLVADLNADPRDCARWISPLFPLMKSGSALILTMKLPHATIDSEIANGQPIIEAAAELLSFGWTAFHCRWLIANTVNERTLFAFRRASPVGPPPSQDAGRQDVFNVRRSHQYRKERALQKLQRRSTAQPKNVSFNEIEASSAS
jgi:hypothetical protein